MVSSKLFNVYLYIWHSYLHVFIVIFLENYIAKFDKLLWRYLKSFQLVLSLIVGFLGCWGGMDIWISFYFFTTFFYTFMDLSHIKYNPYQTENAVPRQCLLTLVRLYTKTKYVYYIYVAVFKFNWIVILNTYS